LELSLLQVADSIMDKQPDAGQASPDCRPLGARSSTLTRRGPTTASAALLASGMTSRASGRRIANVALLDSNEVALAVSVVTTHWA
jgi:hypothetical protein